MILNRYIITDLFLIIIFCLGGINVSAQNQTILIFDPNQVSTNFQNSFHQISSDSIYIADSLDENIYDFDAVFLFIGYPYVLSEEEGSRLIEYLDLNKPIYLYTNLPWQNIDSVAFWNHIGIIWYAETLSEVHVDSVVGVDTAFTKGIVIDTSFISPGAPYIEGYVSPILDGMENRYTGLHSTFIPEDDSLKVIVDLYNLIHHTEFLERVLPHFGLENGPPLIQFYPAVDTAYILGGCRTPEIICRNMISTNERDSLVIKPGENTNFFYYDSLGQTVDIRSFYFIVTDFSDQFEYEIWFHPKSYPPFDPVLVPFDSIFLITHHDFDMQLTVKLSDVPVDSVIKSFRSDFGLVAEQGRMIANDFELHQNYPNPFNPSTKIKFTIPTSPLNPSPYQGEGNRERFITLKVYDVLGNEVATLVNEEKPAGIYEVEFKAAHLSSGIYFYQLKAGSFVETKKMVVMK